MDREQMKNIEKTSERDSCLENHVNRVRDVVGVNTIGSSLGGKEREIQREPSIPIKVVSPWTADSKYKRTYS